MHNSKDGSKETAAVRLYMDESGTLDPKTPQAVIGGMLINYSHFLHFEEAWDEILDRRGIAAPLHMKEFGQHGRFANISKCCRRELFLEVADLIDSHKIASISASLTNAEYKSLVIPEATEVFSVYGMCFCLAAIMSHQLANGRYDGRVHFILDLGNPYSGHVVAAHKSVLTIQKEGLWLHAGGLNFQDDTEFGSLQAADVIAWGARRMASGMSWPPGMEPIGEILTPAKGHNQADFKQEWLKELSGTLSKLAMKKKTNDRGQNHEEQF